MRSILLSFFSVTAFAAAPVKTQGYAGAAWAGSCTNLTTAGSQSSQISFDVSAYPTARLGINGSVFTVPVGQRTNVTLPSKVTIAVLLELSTGDDFTFHTYNQPGIAIQEQQLAFTLVDAKHLTMRQDTWTYAGGGTSAGDSYYCKYSR